MYLSALEVAVSTWGAITNVELFLFLLPDCPKNVEITGTPHGSRSNVVQGTVLKCAADSHPPPSYLWTNLVDNTTVEGDSFTVSEMKYHHLACNATNTVTHANGTNQTCSERLYFEVNGKRLNSYNTTIKVKNLNLKLASCKLQHATSNCNNSIEDISKSKR